jgi:hypothetical protein
MFGRAGICSEKACRVEQLQARARSRQQSLYADIIGSSVKIFASDELAVNYADVSSAVSGWPVQSASAVVEIPEDPSVFEFLLVTIASADE